MAEQTDYYATLGVTPDASTDQIRSAYRQRARQCHPDRVGTDPRPFQDLQQAYATLADAGSRRRYDRSRAPQADRVVVAPAATVAPAVSSRPTRRRAPVEPLIPGQGGPPPAPGGWTGEAWPPMPHSWPGEAWPADPGSWAGGDWPPAGAAGAAAQELLVVRIRRGQHWVTGFGRGDAAVAVFYL